MPRVKKEVGKSEKREVPETWTRVDTDPTVTRGSVGSKGLVDDGRVLSVEGSGGSGCTWGWVVGERVKDVSVLVSV